MQKFGISVLKAHTSPLAIFAIYSPKGTYDATFLANYAYVNVNDPMTRVNGIGQVLIQGAGQYAMRFWVKPDQLAKLSITITDLVTALDKQNIINAAGQVGAQPVPPGQAFTYTMRTQGRLVTEQEFGDIVVRANPDGSLVRMRDVARVELGAQTYNNIGRLNGAPAAIVNVYQLPGFNALEAVQGARRLMEDLKQRFPVDMDYVVSLDTTLAVTEGIREIYTTLWQAMLLVILVVFIFLQSARATLIPAVAVPGVPRRDVRLLPAARLLHQHAVALRAGPRHRPRGGRRDRGGGGGGEEAGGRPRLRRRRPSRPCGRSPGRWWPSPSSSSPCSRRPPSSPASPGASTSSSP